MVSFFCCHLLGYSWEKHYFIVTAESKNICHYWSLTDFHQVMSWKRVRHGDVLKPCLLNSVKRLRLVMDGPVKTMVFFPEMFWHSCLATRLWSWVLFFKVARVSEPWPSFRCTAICGVRGQAEKTPHRYLSRITSCKQYLPKQNLNT